MYGYSAEAQQNSYRTSMAHKSEFGGSEIIPIRLKAGILHRDTVFNIISNEKALMFEAGIFEKDTELL